ncbi:MAG: 2-hydroxyacyl-CoA dehydratase [Clostridia bacterium]|nr:2-hydroxyacyl-CoA dehydratase [Clostridia bacterium]
MQYGTLAVGLDVGSTTVKVVIIDKDGNILYNKYQRHYSDIRKTIYDVMNEALAMYKDCEATFTITGSGGMLVSEWLNLPFVQEVVASTHAVTKLIPDTDVAIELGGEDAKITFFSNPVEQRMNGTCAGGTGAFIDQMAILLKTDAQGLNDYASRHKIIYPIAARCGVFAKTDIQPLLNEGASKEDIAASVFQSVVNQTISGLACGRRITGKVALLGGPLNYLSELRARFIETLGLTDETLIFPNNSHLFVALGAAFVSQGRKGYENTIKVYNVSDVINNLGNVFTQHETEVGRLTPLFNDDNEYNEFKDRHSKAKAQRGDLGTYKGNCYLGIDAGSTTTKATVIGENDEILYSWYGSNFGNPFESAAKILRDIYSIIPADAKIAYSCVTGYGEGLIKTALGVDFGEIETIAHYTAAEKFLPGVDFILDIGGQDMKCLKIKNGVIQSIMLNEACSSGCGSFIEAFATSLSLDVSTFAGEAMKSKSPVDLGSRCTVFMNSRVKQAQKEGASVADISAGLSFSVIKNALTKVIKIKTPEEMGEKLIVQGGTFLNDAILRCFEIVSERQAVRPDIAGLMGAYGCSLIAHRKFLENPEYKTTLLGKEDTDKISCDIKRVRCGKCTNNCLLTINCFSNGSRFITGNRCERGSLKESDGIKEVEDLNLFKYKYTRLFDYYKPLSDEKAYRGTIGIPRVLNMYENYPFWFTFFTKLGYKVVLSDSSSKDIYNLGIETIPSESVCYPGKLVHGHIINLLDKGVKNIFYPSIPYEIKEDKKADNHYNCPIVTSYPEVISVNVDRIKEENINFMHPFLPLYDKKAMVERLYEEFSQYDISKAQVREAVNVAYEEFDLFKEDIRAEAQKIIRFAKEHNYHIICLAGRPYHLDPEINHGIPELLTKYDFAVLTEDSISHLGDLETPIRVVNQWAYHSRLYRAADYIKVDPCIDMIQLNSFGCGLDAVTTDQVEEILKSSNRIYTCFKIDEGSNLGAIRIRVRSLKAALENRDYKDSKIGEKKPYSFPKVVFTQQMRKDYTILAPQMSPIHFDLVQHVFRHHGYNLEVLPSNDRKAIDWGLKYVNNDACFPSIIVVGQFVEALKSGKYDLNKVALLITQTGGGCRATNYIAFIRKALKDMGLGHIPVISLSVSGLESNPGFKPTVSMINSAIKALAFGDLFMRVLYRTRPYELEAGSADKLYEKWNEKCKDVLSCSSSRLYDNTVKSIVEEFDNLPLKDIVKPKVGLVGEILVKFHPTANNNVVDIVESEGAEAVMPDLLDFFFYCAYSPIEKRKRLKGKRSSEKIARIVISYMEHYRKPLRKYLSKSKRFSPPSSIYELAELAESVLSLSNNTGEGWFLTAEMLELIHSGASNIVCMQPFACLPNHVTGKGMIKELRRQYPKANIVAVDYDPGASEVNQLNRIRLMLSAAFDNMEE